MPKKMCLQLQQVVLVMQGIVQQLMISLVFRDLVEQVFHELISLVRAPTAMFLGHRGSKDLELHHRVMLSRSAALVIIVAGWRFW